MVNRLDIQRPTLGNDIDSRDSKNALSRKDKPSEPLFLVEHPITIRWEGDNPRWQCILVSSYSAFPVNLGEDFCEPKK